MSFALVGSETNITSSFFCVFRCQISFDFPFQMRPELVLEECNPARAEVCFDLLLAWVVASNTCTRPAFSEATRGLTIIGDRDAVKARAQSVARQLIGLKINRK